MEIQHAFNAIGGSMLIAIFAPMAFFAIAILLPRK